MASLRPELPARLWLVRHAESTGNLAREAALRVGATTIALTGRDADVALSDTGRRQAAALGDWFSAQDPQPDVILSSPYKRARDTALEIAMRCAIPAQEIRLDERLREKEFGIIDGLTRAGIEQRYPDVSASRTALGKFYHRPPGGESWCDVILRLRSLLASLYLEYPGKHVVIVSHQVVVLCMRYLLEILSEEEILAIDREGDILNCAITDYIRADNKLCLDRYNWVAPVAQAGAPVTAEPDRVDKSA